MWPKAVNYAVFTYNILPRRNRISPTDIFLVSRVHRYQLRNLYVWRCPLYVLNPSLQAGKKIPRCELRSKRGFFVVSAQSTPQKYHKFWTWPLVASVLSSTWSLMIFSPLCPVLRGRMIHLCTGKTCAWKTLRWFLLTQRLHLPFFWMALNCWSRTSYQRCSAYQ